MRLMLDHRPYYHGHIHVSGSRITGVLAKTLESGRDRLKVSLHTTIVEVGGVINKGVGHGIF